MNNCEMCLQYPCLRCIQNTPEDNMSERLGPLKLTLLNRTIRSAAPLEHIKPLLISETMNIPDTFGRTPIMNAVLWSEPECVEYIFSNCAKQIEFTHIDAGGRNIFHNIVLSDRENAIELATFLLENIPETQSLINMKDEDGDTPILVAYKYQNEKMVRLLLENGADPSIANNSGKSILDMEGSDRYVSEYLESFIKTPDE